MFVLVHTKTVGENTPDIDTEGCRKSLARQLGWNLKPRNPASQPEILLEGGPKWPLKTFFTGQFF